MCGCLIGEERHGCHDMYYGSLGFYFETVELRITFSFQFQITNMEIISQREIESSLIFSHRTIEPSAHLATN